MKHNEQENTPLIWNIEDLAKYLRVSVPSAYRAVRLKKIPKLDLGTRSLRFDRESVIRALREHPDNEPH